MGLESITKVSGGQYSSPASTTMSQSIQAADASASVNDYSAAQQAAVVYRPSSQTEVSGESAENNVTLADVKDISKVLNANTVAEFGVYEPMNRITIKIKDKDSGEVIKEIPSEKMLKMFAKACELAGLLVDEKR